jgi:hypothetical protein
VSDPRTTAADVADVYKGDVRAAQLRRSHADRVGDIGFDAAITGRLHDMILRRAATL